MTTVTGQYIGYEGFIAWPFSQQIAIGNAGSTLPLESMGGRGGYGCLSLNILIYLNSNGVNSFFYILFIYFRNSIKGLFFSLGGSAEKGGPIYPFPS